MSVSKIEKYRYWLTYMLDDMPVGTDFLPTALHATVLPWFVVDPGVESALNESFISQFSGSGTFTVVVGEEASLGPREDVSVLLLEDAPQLFDIHKMALNWFESLNARWAVKHPYVGDDYVPHIRLRSDTQLVKGDKLPISAIYLVKALRRASDDRQVAAKVKFDA